MANYAYRPRRCEGCGGTYQPTGPRGVRCVECSGSGAKLAGPRTPEPLPVPLAPEALAAETARLDALCNEPCEAPPVGTEDNPLCVPRAVYAELDAATTPQLRSWSVDRLFPRTASYCKEVLRQRHAA